MDSFWTILFRVSTFIVGCRCVVQLGGLVPGYPWEVPLRLRLVSLLIADIQKYLLDPNFLAVKYGASSFIENSMSIE